MIHFVPERVPLNFNLVPNNKSSNNAIIIEWSLLSLNIDLTSKPWSRPPKLCYFICKCEQKWWSTEFQLFSIFSLLTCTRSLMSATFPRFWTRTKITSSRSWRQKIVKKYIPSPEIFFTLCSTPNLSRMKCSTALQAFGLCLILNLLKHSEAFFITVRFFALHLIVNCHLNN